MRPQAIPCDGGIQTEDRSDELAPKDAFGYRSVVGTCLYLARDRPDLLFTVKELSGAMSRPTCKALQRLRKLVGYLKATPNYCVLLEIPTGGQGKWHATDQFWLLESFSNSDWSSNQSHRRSTSCGVHMLNGSFLFASSRTQRVVSLSSCESELHAMVSTLSDGFFLRRCIQFVCNCEAEHMMYTDSSSGRQLVMRQGTGKVKHVSGKILWIQDAIRNNVFKLSQIPTMWNISDIGTKSLGVQRVHLLLHEMNVASSSDGFCPIGEPEYHMQSKRHGGRQMTKLAKQIARVLMVMGLESSTLRGVAAFPMSVLDSDGLADNQCSLEPNAYNQYEPFSYTAIFLMTMVFLGVVLFMARTFKWAKDAYESYEHSYGVIAMTDSLVDRLCNETKTLRGEVNEMKNQIAELQRGHKLLEGQDDILSDQADSLHYGLVMLRGYTIHSELTPAQRQHMFTIERANLVAARTMGANRYMSTVMQQNRGVAFGDDTDMMENPTGASSMGEGAESEAPTFDRTVPVSEASGELTRIHDTLRQELNSFLARENWEEATEIQ